MVFEALYSPQLILRRKGFDFLLGFVFSIFGMAAGLFLFPRDPSLVAIAFIAILLLPSVVAMIKIQRDVIHKAKNLKVALLSSKDLLVTYLLIFLGILLAFGVFAILLPNIVTSHLFATQVSVLQETHTDYTAGFGEFRPIFMNNLRVFAVTLAVALMFGTGGVFIITWNASVFGTIFGIIAKSQAALTSSSPVAGFVNFAIIVAVVLPHMVLEASAYSFAGITGGIVSDSIEVRDRKIYNRLFKYAGSLIALSFCLLLLAAAVEAEISPVFAGLFLS
ncbi:MAG: stage II sporulation protein M [archaeon]